MAVALLDILEEGRGRARAEGQTVYLLLVGNGEPLKCLKSWEEHDQICVLERFEADRKMDGNLQVMEAEGLPQPSEHDSRVGNGSSSSKENGWVRSDLRNRINRLKSPPSPASSFQMVSRDRNPG